MRVISQDGTMDMPYEMSIIWSEDNGAVLLQAVGETGEYQSFAKYSTEEKAKKAMEELQYAYVCHNIAMFDKGIANDIPNDKMMKTVIGGVFQFPTEEELDKA